MRARSYLIILIAGLALIATLSLSGALRHQPLRYGYSLTLELEADGKSYPPDPHMPVNLPEPLCRRELFLDPTS